MAGEDGGTPHLRFIWRVQLVLLPIGAAAWGVRSPLSSVFFLAGGAFGLLAWRLHCWSVGGMLTPTVRLRWIFALAGVAKLVLIAVLLVATIKHFPMEVLPLVTGLMLFVAAILAEAARLIVAPGGRGKSQP